MQKDPAAARVAWHRFSPMVRRMVRRTLGPHADIEDVVQDVFLCLFDRAPSLREPQALDGFVISITARTLSYVCRRARVRRWVGLSPDIEQLGTVHADASSRAALIHFYGILDRLSTRDRMSFVLRFVEGMSGEEVAQALGVSMPTARRSFTRAWQRVTYLAQLDPFLEGYVESVSPPFKDLVPLDGSDGLTAAT